MEIIGTPNFWKGRHDYKPIAIVLHICEGTEEGTVAWFQNPKSDVSAHYLVCKNGHIINFVPEENTAWHAGYVYNPTWKLIKNKINPNLYTIGIEHEGFADEPAPLLQLAASARLIASIAARWNIPRDTCHIIGHNMINGHKTCPGRGILRGYLIHRAAMEAELIEKLNE